MYSAMILSVQSERLRLTRSVRSDILANMGLKRRDFSQYSVANEEEEDSGKKVASYIAFYSD